MYRKNTLELLFHVDAGEGRFVVGFGLLPIFSVGFVVLFVGLGVLRFGVRVE